jgi:hypothetical protein
VRQRVERPLLRHSLIQQPRQWLLNTLRLIRQPPFLIGGHRWWWTAATIKTFRCFLTTACCHLLLQLLLQPLQPYLQPHPPPQP